MKNGEKSLYSLHAKLLLNLENLNLKDLRILLIESSLFCIDEKDIVSILFTPQSGRSLLKLATNIEQTTSSRLGNYSLINNSQVFTAFWPTLMTFTSHPLGQLGKITTRSAKFSWKKSCIFLIKGSFCLQNIPHCVLDVL